MALSHEPTVVRICKMPLSLSDAIRTHAGKLGVSDSDVIRAACAAYIGIDVASTHGNAKYTTDQERIEARRARHRAKRALSKALLRSISDASTV